MDDTRLIDVAMRQLEVLDPLLFKLFEKGEIDPWNIDLEKLCSLYAEEVRKRRDLRISGNAVVSAAAILKFKLEKLLEKRKEKKSTEEIEPIEIDVEIIPQRRYVKAVTIFDLLDALEDLLRKERKTRKRGFKLEVDRVNLSKIMEEILLECEKKGGLRIAGVGAHALLAMLHLATSGKIAIFQVEWNGTLEIKKVG